MQSTSLIPWNHSFHGCINWLRLKFGNVSGCQKTVFLKSGRFANAAETDHHVLLSLVPRHVRWKRNFHLMKRIRVKGFAHWVTSGERQTRNRTRRVPQVVPYKMRKFYTSTTIERYFKTEGSDNRLLEILLWSFFRKVFVVWWKTRIMAFLVLWEKKGHTFALCDHAPYPSTQVQ
jgi:hypothetical protein